MNILLVSDNENATKEITSKLIFLRKNDNIASCTYEKAKFKINDSNVILVCEHHDKAIPLITEIRENNSQSIIFIADEYNQESILEACDAGANDFILASAEPYEYVLRIVNNIKLNDLKNELNRESKLLMQFGGIDEFSGIYNCAEKAIENAININGIFIAIAPAQDAKETYSADRLIDVLKSSKRSSDILAHGKGANLYLFLPNSDINGAVAIINKIQEKVSFAICAGFSTTHNKTYAEIEKTALKALQESSARKALYTFTNEEKEETLQELLHDDKKNYKLFNQIFNKKLEKVIAPVFYRLQKAYEEKLFDTKIEQHAAGNQCAFNLKNKKGSSSLSIIYPGFTKIVISIVHDGLDSPENREFKLQLSNVTQRELGEIVEDFIKEFKMRW